MSRGRWLAATLAAAVLLAGCGSGSGDSGDDAAASASHGHRAKGKHGGVRRGDAGDPGAQASDLASAAEKLAKKGGGGDDVAPRDGAVLGGDISWPQCPPGMGIPQKKSSGQPMPLPDAEFLLLGLTNGPGFTPNPCLGDQVDWAKTHGMLVAAYSVLSYPDDATITEYGGNGPYDASTTLGQLKNVGYQQAQFNIGSLGEAGLATPVVWLDVEPVPDFAWSTDTRANAAIVQGAARGYADAGYAVGVYSTPIMWRDLVGDLSLGLPEWRPAGQTSRAEAVRRCADDWSIQGGEGVLGQWVEDRRDRNITCPGTSAELGRWFHQT